MMPNDSISIEMHELSKQSDDNSKLSQSKAKSRQLQGQGKSQSHSSNHKTSEDNEKTLITSKIEQIFPQKPQNSKFQSKNHQNKSNGYSKSLSEVKQSGIELAPSGQTDKNNSQHQHSAIAKEYLNKSISFIQMSPLSDIGTQQQAEIYNVINQVNKMISDKKFFNDQSWVFENNQLQDQSTKVFVELQKSIGLIQIKKNGFEGPLHFQNVLRAIQKQKGKHSAQYIDNIENKINALRKMGRYQQALISSLQKFELMRPFFGSQPDLMPEAFRLLGIAFSYVKYNDLAKIMCQHAIKLYQALNQQISWGYQRVCTNLGNLFQSDPQQSLFYLEKAYYTMCRIQSNPKDIWYQITVYNYGHALMVNNKLQQALIHFKNCLNVFQEVKGVDHLINFNTHNLIAKCYAKMQKFYESCLWFNQALKLFELEYDRLQAQNYDRIIAFRYIVQLQEVVQQTKNFSWILEKLSEQDQKAFNLNQRLKQLILRTDKYKDAISKKIAQIEKAEIIMQSDNDKNNILDNIKFDQ